MKWKEELLRISSKPKEEKGSNGKDDAEKYGLPTSTLKNLIFSWMDHVVAVGMLKRGSSDERWLSSTEPFDDERLEELLVILRVWVYVAFCAKKSIAEEGKALAQSLLQRMCVEDLKSTAFEETEELIGKDGTAAQEAYRMIPLLAAERLAGKTLMLRGVPLLLHRGTGTELVSQPLKGSRRGDLYSIVLDFSIQTTPPDRQALFLVHAVTRRWIPDFKGERESVYLENRVNAYVFGKNATFYRIPLYYAGKDQGIWWSEGDLRCWENKALRKLPEAKELCCNPMMLAPEVLLTYKNGMSGFPRPVIGTGISMDDKACLFEQVLPEIRDLLSDAITLERVRPRRFRIQRDLLIKEEKGAEEIEKESEKEAGEASGKEGKKEKAKWVRDLSAYSEALMDSLIILGETRRLFLEIYYDPSEPSHAEAAELARRQFETDFHSGQSAPPAEVIIRVFPRRELLAPLKNDGAHVLDELRERADMLEEASAVTASLIILGSKESFKEGDPKRLIRAAFARKGRVTQFLDPKPKDDEPLQFRLDHAVKDLYRQLGIYSLIDRKAVESMEMNNVLLMGVYLWTQVQGITSEDGKEKKSNKARFLPVYVRIEPGFGAVRVLCSAFERKGWISYREACLETSKLYFDPELERKSISNSQGRIEGRIAHLKNTCSPEKRALVLVMADGNTRAVWKGLSDKSISESKWTESGENYCYYPSSIDCGGPNYPKPLSLKNSEVRIVRVRGGVETPDYYTPLSVRASDTQKQRASVNGLFGYGKVFYSLAERIQDKKYTNSLRRSRVESPRLSFAEKTLIELFPMQLQPGDDPVEWVSFAAALRRLSIQYDQQTNLPLPLHLAKALSEYLYE